MAVPGSPVGIATELTVVAQLRIGALDYPAKSEPHRCWGAGVGLGPALDVEVIEAETGELGTDLRIVVGAVEVQGVDLIEQTQTGDVFESRAQQLHVVAVGPVDRPADRDAVGVDSDGPFPAQFRPISRVFAGPFSTTGCLVQRPVEGHLAEIEADDAVIGFQSVSTELVEHARADPFIATGPEGGVGDLELEDRFDADPRTTGDQSDEDPPKAQSIGNTGAVTAQGMGPVWGG